MLLRVILENFLSFDKAQEFNMFPNKRRVVNRHHVYSDKKVSLLKQAAIYGNNASGKSNFIKGVRFLKRFVVDENYLSKEFAERVRYRLNPDNILKPIELLIEFEVDNKFFIYDIALSSDGVEREDLYLSGLSKENTLLYHRSLKEVELGESVLDKQQEKWEHTKDIVAKMLSESHRYSSFLSLLKTLPVVNNDDIDLAYKWFYEKLDVIGIYSELPQLISLLYENKDILSFANRIFEEMSIGVDAVGVQSIDAEEWLAKHAKELSTELVQDLPEGEALSAYHSPNRPIYTALVENGRKKVQELIFKQMGSNGTFNLDVRDQSDGTVRILTLLPAIYSAIFSDKVIVIDEINHCLHPNLLFDLVRFFADSDTKGQLIFSTHEIELMERNGVLRNDEIWLVDKKDGASYMYSLNEFNIHNTLSVSRGYREGRFGGSYKGDITTYAKAQI